MEKTREKREISQFLDCLQVSDRLRNGSREKVVFKAAAISDLSDTKQEMKGMRSEFSHTCSRRTRFVIESGIDPERLLVSIALFHGLRECVS